MPDQELITKFRKFIEQYAYEELLRQIKEGKQCLVIDYGKLSSFDYKLAEELLSAPLDIIKAAEIAIEEFDIPEAQHPIRVRLSNLPKSQRVQIRNIRSKHLGKLIWTDGLIRQASDVRPKITIATFDCPACGAQIMIEQDDMKFKEPARCQCGRTGRFRMKDKKLVDLQRLFVEESPESLEGGDQSKRIAVYVSEDLLDPKLENRRQPGNKVTVVGVVKETPVPLPSGGQSTKYDLFIDTNNIETVEEEFVELKVSPEEEEKIKRLAEDPDIYEKLAACIAPSIYGYTNIKEAIVLQLFGGVRKERPDGTSARGDVHLLLIGDPGSGKSEILRYVDTLAPKSRYVVGMSTSSAGICVTGDSLVQLSSGEIVEIEKLVKEKIIGTKANPDGIFSKKISENSFSIGTGLNIQPSKITHCWKLPVKSEIVKITTQSGKEILTTAETPVISIKNDSLQMWQHAKSIQKGDRIATVRKLPEGDGSVDILKFTDLNKTKIQLSEEFIKRLREKITNKYGDLRKASKKGEINENLLYHSVFHYATTYRNLKKLCKLADINLTSKDIQSIFLRNGKPFRLPEVNEEFMYLFGLLLGDGDISVESNRGVIRISNSNVKLLQKVIDLVKDLFGKDIKIEYSDKRIPVVRLSIMPIAKLFYAAGMRSPKNDLDIHSKLTRLPNSKIAALLRGLFDTDGSVYVRKNKNSGSSVIDFSTISRQLAKKIQLLLLRFGVHAKVREKDNIGVEREYRGQKIITRNKIYVLEIWGVENFKKFKEYIGFSFEKKDALDKINLGRSHPNLDVVPIKNYLKVLCKKYDIKTRNYWVYTQGIHNPSQRILKELISVINKKISKEELKKLRALANADVYWDKVTSVSTINDIQWVYDLTVLKEHNFIANGFIVHNTAAVVKDEFMRGWALEAGAIVLADNGIILIDELDKMNKEDRSAMHSAMEQQIVSIHKANIQATLRSRTAVLGAANPKFGRFDPYSPIASQIDLPSTLINRFDLIFTVRDLPDAKNDEVVASHVLELHQRGGSVDVPIDSKLLRKYIAYAKQTCFPVLTASAIDAIKRFYVDLRNAAVSDSAEIKPIPISARQLQALVRLAEASARVRLSDKVLKKDAAKAIELLKSCMQAVGTDPETGKFDIDRISTGITASKRGRISTIKRIIDDLENKVGKAIQIKDVLAECEQEGIDRQKVEEILEDLKKTGDIYEPKPGIIQKVGR